MSEINNVRALARKTGILLPVFLLACLLTGCEKLISIPDPAYSVTPSKVFSNDKQAASAIAGVYSYMINGEGNNGNGFACGVSSFLGGQSADELMALLTNGSYGPFVENKLLQDGNTMPIWKSAYSTIYDCNAILEGIAASESNKLSDSARRRLTGEAKFVRAFSNFYLVNFFGDVPLVLTTNFNETARSVRTPKDQVYKKIIQDLKEAKDLLAADYNVSAGERVRPNKWAATAMLARAYLYTRDYDNAFLQSGEVIANSHQYKLVEDLNQVFHTNSMEAIWQLKQSNEVATRGNATAEGISFIPFPLATGIVNYPLSIGLLNAFEPGDKRRNAWVGTSDQYEDNGYYVGPGYFAYKYKTGRHNYSAGGAYTEYSMVLRLAEQYLIRAEAQANGAGGGPSAAISDLNEIRDRADLPELPEDLLQTAVISAVEKEWQTEFFCEWGHRWFNLKRTGRASQVLSAISYKKPWWGDYQLLYPIPIDEIKNNNNLIQNKGY